MQWFTLENNARSRTPANVFATYHCSICLYVCVCVCVFDMLSLTNAGAVPKQLINMHINQMCVIACVCVHEYTEKINDLPYPLWLAAK